MQFKLFLSAQFLTIALALSLGPNLCYSSSDSSYEYAFSASSSPSSSFHALPMGSSPSSDQLQQQVATSALPGSPGERELRELLGDCPDLDTIIRTLESSLGETPAPTVVQGAASPAAVAFGSSFTEEQLLRELLGDCTDPDTIIKTLEQSLSATPAPTIAQSTASPAVSAVDAQHTVEGQWRQAVQAYAQIKHQVKVLSVPLTDETVMGLLSSVSTNGTRYPWMRIVADYFCVKMCMQGRSQDLTDAEVVRILDGIILNEITPAWMKESAASFRSAILLPPVPLFLLQ